MESCHLEFAFINISRNLELVLNDNKSVSSHLKLKEDVLSSLKDLLTHAPLIEFQKLLDIKDREIIIGYLLSCLCRLAKDDKSRSIRMKSLSIMHTIIDKLMQHHDYFLQVCSLSLIRDILPGLCSCLFKIVMGDTKQPKDLFVIALDLLSKLIEGNYRKCDHRQAISDDKTETDEVSENLGLRLVFLVDYIMNHSTELGQSVLMSTITLSGMIVAIPNLLKHNLNCMVRFLAFMSAQSDLDHLIDKLRSTIGENEDLDSVISLGLVKQVDELNQNYISLLASERKTQIALITGYITIIPPSSLTTLMELDDFRDKLVDLLANLTTFSNQQAFLFLTDILIGGDALETNNNRICKSEKRFEHNLTKHELSNIEQVCHHFGRNLEWNCLSDMLTQLSCNFSCPSRLLIYRMILKGSIERDKSLSIGRFLNLTLKQYIDFIEEQNITIDSGISDITNLHILRVIIAIETIETIVGLMLKFNNKPEICRALHSILCPLLICASSSSRSISESSLTTLAQISHCYGHKSIKDLIENNTDYVVDGISKMLDHRGINDQLANVLAITFKLSSIETFYFFKDIYEKVFTLTGEYHWHSLKTRSIALLFSRTVEILNNWRLTGSDNWAQTNDDELSVVFDPKRISRDIHIGSRIRNLQTAIDSQKSSSTSEPVNEDQVIADIESAKTIKYESEKKNDDNEPKPKAMDILITERILVHSINLLSANDVKTKILALNCASNGFRILSQDEDALLPLVHKTWAPLVHRLTGDYSTNLEVNLAAFECLVSMARVAKDFIKHRTLDAILPRICLFLESQANHSTHQKEYGPYCSTMAYKCQLVILKNLGPLVYNIELGYKHLWRIITVSLIYLNQIQVPALCEAARQSLMYLMAADCDCVWYFAKKVNKLESLPFDLIYDDINPSHIAK